jgi:cytoskeletal protein RodZ
MLRNAREHRGVGLRQIADITRISARALEALERNDISQLPGGIFSRAFVRAYAVQVGLDPEETVEEFLRQFPHDSVRVGHATVSQKEIDEAFNDARPQRAWWPWILAGLVIAGLAASYFLRSS